MELSLYTVLCDCFWDPTKLMQSRIHSFSLLFTIPPLGTMAIPWFINIFPFSSLCHLFPVFCYSNNAAINILVHEFSLSHEFSAHQKCIFLNDMRFKSNVFSFFSFTGSQLSHHSLLVSLSYPYKPMIPSLSWYQIFLWLGLCLWELLVPSGAPERKGKGADGERV